MKPEPRKPSAGFTLLEMTIALSLSLGIASTVVGLLQQQVSFTRLLSKFQFLREEAPQVNTLLATLIQTADSYRVYGNRSDAFSGSGAILEEGRALRLRLRNPDGTEDHAVVAFESFLGKNCLNFYFRPSGQSAWPSSPNWTISSKLALVDFSNRSGVLLVTMTGPDDEQITYAGNPI
jgi:type II secretory pathway pseudopilin PulG